MEDQTDSPEIRKAPDAPEAKPEKAAADVPVPGKKGTGGEPERPQLEECPALRTIRLRRSCRAYSGKPLDDGLMADLRQTASDMATPFGGEVRIDILARDGSPFAALGNRATYGVVSDAPAFFAAVAPLGKRGWVDCGFALESMVLRAAELGLATCWQGGSFSRKEFSRAMRLGKDESVACVVAVGEARRGRSVRDRAMEIVFRTSSRKAWPEIFFDEAMGRTLERKDVDPRAAQALEAVRLAPSACNRQEWRVVRTCGGKRYELFVTPQGRIAASHRLLGVDMRMVDAGIAMCHFQRVAAQTGLPGGWTGEEAPLTAVPGDMEFVAVWR